METEIFELDHSSVGVKAFNTDFREDSTPLLADCECKSCKSHTKAYIYHLLKHNEMTSSVLLTIHNCHTYSLFFRLLNTTFIKNNIALSAIFLKHLT